MFILFLGVGLFILSHLFNYTVIIYDPYIAGYLLDSL